MNVKKNGSKSKNIPNMKAPRILQIKSDDEDEEEEENAGYSAKIDEMREKVKNSGCSC